MSERERERERARECVREKRERESARERASVSERERERQCARDIILICEKGTANQCCQGRGFSPHNWAILKVQSREK